MSVTVTGAASLVPSFLREALLQENSPYIPIGAAVTIVAGKLATSMLTNQLKKDLNPPQEEQKGWVKSFRQCRVNIRNSFDQAIPENSRMRRASTIVFPENILFATYTLAQLDAMAPKPIPLTLTVTITRVAYLACTCFGLDQFRWYSSYCFPKFIRDMFAPGDFEDGANREYVLFDILFDPHPHEE